jgi:hypothetical protein
VASRQRASTDRCGGEGQRRDVWLRQGARGKVWVARLPELIPRIARPGHDELAAVESKQGANFVILAGGGVVATLLQPPAALDQSPATADSMQLVGPIDPPPDDEMVADVTSLQ